jgi:ABC-type sugar transport system permease subunit
MTKGAFPLKFLAVGLIFFSIFVVTPTGYTILMSTFNFKTGNEIAKAAALTEIINNGIVSDAEGTAYDLFLGKTSNGKYAGILENQISREVLYADESGVRPAKEAEISRDISGFITGADGIKALTDEEFANLSPRKKAALKALSSSVGMSIDLPDAPEIKTLVDGKQKNSYLVYPDGRMEKLDLGAK